MMKTGGSEGGKKVGARCHGEPISFLLKCRRGERSRRSYERIRERSDASRSCTTHAFPVLQPIILQNVSHVGENRTGS